MLTWFDGVGSRDDTEPNKHQRDHIKVMTTVMKVLKPREWSENMLRSIGSSPKQGVDSRHCLLWEVWIFLNQWKWSKITLLSTPDTIAELTTSKWKLPGSKFIDISKCLFQATNVICFCPEELSTCWGICEHFDVMKDQAQGPPSNVKTHRKP